MTATRSIEVHPTNAGALEAWDGGDGDYWTEHDDVFDGSTVWAHRALFEAAGIGPTDRVLDVGCGTGQTTREAARLAGRGHALGVDLSSRMLDRARQRAAEEGLTNVRFVQADAQIHPFEPGAFDLAISRTGAMFFGDPLAAFTNISGALRGGGQLVLFVWQALPLNEWVLALTQALSAGRSLPTPPPGAPGPFSLSDPERVDTVLRTAGFTGVELQGVSGPMCFGPDADSAYRFLRGMGFTEYMLRDLDDQRRTAALACLRASVDDHTSPEGVLYAAAGWIITGRRA